ncbi:MAG: 1-acyl-sn-glycerol-3-phosphate acyltransferase [Acidobacteria bacterium]|nr:1-acyl-sn-glycerol-3-phosphate acyltransferase [Acidobacteriota bacterium]
MLWTVARALLWIDPLILLATAVMGSISFLASLVDGTGRRQHRIARRWARQVLAIAGAKVKVTGIENLTPGVAYVFCPNHLSLIDTPLMFGYLPWEFRTLAKKELFGTPFLGWHLRRAGHLPVAPEDVRSSARSIVASARRVSEGVSILIFPEGERGRGAGLEEFKAGAAFIAIKAGAPIVPVGILGTRQVHKMGSIIVRPSKVELRIGKPIPTTGMGSRDAERLLAELRERIEELIRSPIPVAQTE